MPKVEPREQPREKKRVLQYKRKCRPSGLCLIFQSLEEKDTSTIRCRPTASVLLLSLKIFLGRTNENERRKEGRKEGRKERRKKRRKEGGRKKGRKEGRKEFGVIFSGHSIGINWI